MALFRKALAQTALYFSLVSGTGCSAANYIECYKNTTHDCLRRPHLLCVQHHNEFDSKTRRDTLKELQESIEEKLYCVVAGLQKKLGNYKQAIEAYVNANDFESAGDLEEEHGDAGKSKEYYEHALKLVQCPECTFRIAEKTGNDKAVGEAKKNLIVSYVRWHMFDRAAELAEELKEIDAAIGYREKADQLFRAAELCELKGYKKRALGIYMKIPESEKECARLSMKIAEAAERKVEYAAEEAERKLNYAEAIEYYQKAGDFGVADGFRKAVRVAQKSGDLESEIFNSQNCGEYEANKVELVAKAKEQISVFGELGDLRKAARLEYLIGNRKRAMLIYGYADQLEELLKKESQ